MRIFLAMAVLGLAFASSNAQAQVGLSTYTDANGFLDVQTLTCAQLANTWQQDADMLTTWYSGWYNGLAKKHLLHVGRSKEVEHQVIEYCKANPQLRIIDAIAVIFKDDRARQGVEY
ncbi:MAG: HdeA/HdeB family chaperone [Xanthobacteraceae bacterium]